MWQLSMTNAAKEWIEVGRFETITAAAARILELEESPKKGMFLKLWVDTELGNDEELLSVFHHTGSRARYGIRRSTN